LKLSSQLIARAVEHAIDGPPDEIMRQINKNEIFLKEYNKKDEIFLKEYNKTKIL
jgi:hypothetical protein